MNELQLQPVNAQVFRVISRDGTPVGSLKLIGGTWKFKAMGLNGSGQVVPGGGPLTDRHNTVFAVPDESAVNAVLLANGTAGSVEGH